VIVDGRDTVGDERAGTATTVEFTPFVESTTKVTFHVVLVKGQVP